MTVAEMTADGRAGISLNADLSVTPFSEVYNEQGKFLGLFDGSLVVSILSFAFGGFTALLPNITAIIIKKDVLDSLPSNFFNVGVNLSNRLAEQSLADLAKAGAYQLTFRSAPDQSHFERSGETVKYNYIFEAFVSDRHQLGIDEYRRIEVDFYNSLSDPNCKRVVVASGDTVWSLTKSIYGDPRLYPLVMEAGGLSTSSLKVGQALCLPQWHNICQKTKANPLFVKDGDSLWAKSRRGEIPLDISRIRTRSGKPDLIYPYEVLEFRRAEEAAAPP